MTILWRGLVLLGIVLGSSLRADEPEIIESDPVFESRLTTSQVYRSRPGETLRDVAHFLYGHRTWWKRLVQMNPQFEVLNPNQVLKVGTPLTYDAPEVGNLYIVQPNDWLIRIVQWKYGNTEYWEAIYRKNAARIANPNLIHPGDRLVLELNGTVRQAASGEVLVEGVEQKRVDAERAPSVPAAPGAIANSASAAHEGQTLSPENSTPSGVAVVPPATSGNSTQPLNLSTLHEESSDQSSSSSLLFILGSLLLGLLVLLGVALFWKRSRKSRKSHQSRKSKPKNLRPARPARPAHPVRPAPVFGQRPADELTWDRSLVHRDEGELPRRASYHTLSQPRKRKSN